MSGVARYRLKPKEVQAIVWTGDNWDEVDAFVDGRFFRHKRDIWLQWEPGEKFDPKLDVHAWVGDYVIKDAAGNLSALHPDEFHRIWEEVA